jgi:hypothetical protein
MVEVRHPRDITPSESHGCPPGDTHRVKRWTQLPFEFRAAIESLDADQIRSLANRAASLAVSRLPEPNDALTAYAQLLSVGAGRPGADEVLRLARELDLFDDEKPDGRSPGWESAFCTARAAMAVAYAWTPDREDLYGAIYEAYHSLSEEDRPLLAGVIASTRIG